MKKMNMDRLDILSFLNGLVFYAPVALLVRTDAGVTTAQFFVLQAILSLTVFIFEIPTGVITDRFGYKNAMILSQVTLFLSKVLLYAAYIRGNYVLFVMEAVVEGFAACFLSGTQEAYIYSVYQDNRYAVKMAHVANFGTAGFIVSTLLYVVFYYFGGIRALMIATIITCGLGIPCVTGVEREPKTKHLEAGAKGSRVFPWFSADKFLLRR
ncbi:MAG: MFS transporter [Lachnospiraceae bacterium]|nr:MFS transporter [Lachnospiraceae bacterium]